MSSHNEILVLDACIIFDLLDLNLIEEFFQLDNMKFVTPQVLSEITNDSQLAVIKSFIQNGILKIESAGTLESIQNIFVENPGLSFTDCSVLELALRINGILLSADKRLRNEAARRTLTVKGMLWIIEEMIRNRIITLDTGIEKLKKYPEINTRIPKKEITNLCINLASRNC